MNHNEFASLSKGSLRILFGMKPGSYYITDIMRFLERGETSAYLAMKDLCKYGLAKQMGNGEFLLKAHVNLETSEPVYESEIVTQKRVAEKELDENADEVLKHLNMKAGKNFRLNEGNRKSIISKLRDGFTVEDCKKVVDFKVYEWGNDSYMRTYLRPQTLFGSKFEAYLNSGSPHDELSRRMDEVMSAPVEDYVLPEELPF